MGHWASFDNLAAELAEWVLARHCEHLQHQPKPARSLASSSTTSSMMPAHPGGPRYWFPPGAWHQRAWLGCSSNIHQHLILAVQIMGLGGCSCSPWPGPEHLCWWACLQYRVLTANLCL